MAGRKYLSDLYLSKTARGVMLMPCVQGWGAKASPLSVAYDHLFGNKIQRRHCGFASPFNSRDHKVLTYVEYRAVSGVFQNIDTPPPSPPSECVFPPHQRRRGVRGQYLEDARHSIGLLQYNPSTVGIFWLCLLCSQLGWRWRSSWPGGEARRPRRETAPGGRWVQQTQAGTVRLWII